MIQLKALIAKHKQIICSRKFIQYKYFFDIIHMFNDTEFFNYQLCVYFYSVSILKYT